MRAITVMAMAVWLGAGAQLALADSDEFIRGYVAAVAGKEYSVSASDIEVQDGVVKIHAGTMGAEQEAQLKKEVEGVQGVKEVRIEHEAAPVVTTTPVAVTKKEEVQAGKQEEKVVHVEGVDDDFRLGLLPGKTLFDPLIADPRWPQVAATYRGYTSGKRFGDDAGSADFGGSLSIYRFKGPFDEEKGAMSEIGLQAGVFSIYNLDAESHDLGNADYFVALSDTFRLDRFSVMTRVLHQSSHLGDEYVLAHINDPGFKRVNLSYEQVNVLGSYDVTKSLRVYGGGAYAFDLDPDNLGPWSIQYGVEYTAPWTIGEHIRPVAAVDFQHKEREQWTLDFSARAGVQFEGDMLRGNRLLLLLEYYAGRDPNGQFLTENVEWWGVGLHWFF
jgi:hypothetical protein